MGLDSWIHSIWGREHTRKDRLNCTLYGNIFKSLRTHIEGQHFTVLEAWN